MRTALLIACLLAPATALAGGGVGYARASSQFKHDSRPTLYQPLNLLDGREVSAWCEGAQGDGVGETVLVGFKESVTIDEVRIATGDQKDATTFGRQNRVRKLKIKDAGGTHTFTLVDERGTQSFKLDVPIEAERVTLEIEETARGTGEEDATCLSDVVFVGKGKALNGPQLTEKLKYDKGRATLMNTWYAGPAGAPDRFLEFYFDGTFHYLYRPFDPEEKVVNLEGEYVLEKDKLKLKLPGKGWVDAKVTQSKKTADDGVVKTVLDISGEALKDTVAQTYADLP